MENKLFCTYCQQWRDPKGSVMNDVKSKTNSTRKYVKRFQCWECHYRRAHKIPADVTLTLKDRAKRKTS